MIIVIRKFLLYSLFLLLFRNAFAQNTFQYPARLSQFFNYYPLINPAATGDENIFSVRLGEQVHAGYYSRVRSFFALSEFSLYSQNRKSHHAFGAAFMNNKEGNLLSFNRVYLQYAYHLAVSEKWKIATGLSTGFLNLAIDPSSTSRNVSSYAPDGSFGFLVYRDKEKIGFSSGQIFNKSIQVIYERIPIKRFYTFFYSRSFLLSPDAKLAPAILGLSKREGFEIDLNANLVLRELILIGISYRYNRGSAYFFGIRNLSFLGGLTDLTVSYNAPWPSSNLGNIQTFEIVLSYKIDLAKHPTSN